MELARAVAKVPVGTRSEIPASRNGRPPISHATKGVHPLSPDTAHRKVHVPVERINPSSQEANVVIQEGLTTGSY